MDTVSTQSRTLFNDLGSSAAPYVLDVRRAAAFDADVSMIAGALRPEGDLAAFAAHAPIARSVVVKSSSEGRVVSQPLSWIVSSLLLLTQTSFFT